MTISDFLDYFVIFAAVLASFLLFFGARIKIYVAKMGARKEVRRR